MSKAFASATYSRQQTCPILVTKNCFLYWDQQTFRKIRDISADLMNPILESTNFFSVLYWSQKTQNNKVIYKYLLRNNSSGHIWMASLLHEQIQHAYSGLHFDITPVVMYA